MITWTQTKTSMADITTLMKANMPIATIFVC